MADDSSGRSLANPRRTDPFADGVPRRRLLRTSSAAGTAAVAGCLGRGGGEERAPTVFAFNTGDRTVTVIDAEADEAGTSCRCPQGV